MDSPNPKAQPPPATESSPPSSSGESPAAAPGPVTTTLDLDSLPETLCYDGYRAAVTVVADARLALLVQLYSDGALVAEEPVWAGDDSDAGRGCADRLLPVLTAACRFLNTETGEDARLRAPGDALETMVRAIGLIGRLPLWALAGVSYVGQKAGGVDVLFDIVGADRALRVVEDQFAEVLGPEELVAWMDARTEEDGPDGEEDDDG